MRRTASPSPRIILAVLSLGGISYALLQSLVVPALPQIQSSLHTSESSVGWVLTAYLLSASVATPIIGRLEALEQVFLHPIHHLGDLLDHRDSLVRDLDEMSATILGIAAPRREASLLQLVEDRDEIGGIEMQLATQRLLRELSMVAKLDQSRDVARTDSERLQRLGEAVHRDPAQFDHQQHRPLLGDAGPVGLSRLRCHGPKASTR